jgi:hypothetical protein
VLWIYAMSAVMFVEGGGYMEFLLAVTAVLLQQIAMDIWSEYIAVS